MCNAMWWLCRCLLVLFENSTPVPLLLEPTASGGWSTGAQPAALCYRLSFAVVKIFARVPRLARPIRGSGSTALVAHHHQHGSCAFGGRTRPPRWHLVSQTSAVLLRRLHGRPVAGFRRLACRGAKAVREAIRTVDLCVCVCVCVCFGAHAWQPLTVAVPAGI